MSDYNTLNFIKNIFDKNFDKASINLKSMVEDKVNKLIETELVKKQGK